MPSDLGNGEKAWSLLIGRLASIEEKVDRIERKVDNWQGVCVTHNQSTAEHEVKINGMNSSIRWLFGIIAGIVIAVIVEVIRGGMK